MTKAALSLDETFELGKRTMNVKGGIQGGYKNKSTLKPDIVQLFSAFIF